MTTRSRVDLAVVKARPEDARAIHDLVNEFARRGEMLPRTMGEIYENLRDFFVIRDGGQVIACAALHILWEDLAEVKSLAVAEERQGEGLGAALVEACVEEAKALGLGTVFALTYRPGFFERLGFEQADVMTLPRKVWNECYRCPKFPGCNEIAMVRALR
ncbi:MAG TPA: N-acetyltransferase [Dehalococcoidia bacterium]|nr:N-acetyltransferase [Dehalococcoidia bacterium]